MEGRNAGKVQGIELDLARWNYVEGRVRISRLQISQNAYRTPYEISTLSPLEKERTVSTVEA